MEHEAQAICKGCGTENNPGDLNCRRCGLPVQTHDQNDRSNLVSCPRCLHPNDPASFFCYNCGKYFVEFEGISGKVNKNKAAENAKSPTLSAKVLMPGGTSISLSGTPTFIERSDFDGTLPNDLLMSISRQHVLITYDNGTYYLQDYGRDGKGSTNHTRLNGTDIYKKGKQPLKDGDKIELASQPELTITFKLVQTEA